MNTDAALSAAYREMGWLQLPAAVRHHVASLAVEAVANVPREHLAQVIDLGPYGGLVRDLVHKLRLATDIPNRRLTDVATVAIVAAARVIQKEIDDVRDA